MTLRAVALALSLVLSLAACGGSDTPASSKGDASMRPGENCLASGCHTSFSAAGTVYASASAGAAAVEGATVVIDGSLQRVVMRTNAAGNFWTTVNFGTGPVTVNSAPMSANVTAFATGACAAAGCHASTRVHP